MGNASYERLERCFARIADLQAASRTVRWFSMTYGPPGGEPVRGHQMATLGGLAHELLVAPECADALSAARAEEPWQAANLREMRRLHRAAAAMPTELVEAKARAVSRAQAVWRRARPEGDFAAFLPALREVVERVREEAQIKGEALGVAPYDALLDSYDPGRRGDGVAAMFAELEAFLPGVIDRARSGPKPPGPEGSRAELERLARRLMAMLGLEEEHVRLDVSAHPFSTGEPEDVRITTRYTGPPGEALLAVLHESGHALYTRGLPRNWRRQPVGRNRGMTAHESQSLSIEMQACRSRAFAVHYARLLNGELAPAEAWEAERLYGVLTHVEPGLVRVEADEASYPLHIVVRHRCEAALISGGLDPADLPDAFDDAVESLLGIRPPGPGEGLHAGHPLVGRVLRIFPDIYPRRAHGGPTRRGHAGVRPRSRPGHRARRFPPARRLAAGQCPQPGVLRCVFRRPRRAGDRKAARYGRVHPPYRDSLFALTALCPRSSRTLFDPRHAAAAASRTAERRTEPSKESSVAAGPVELVGERCESVGKAVVNA